MDLFNPPPIFNLKEMQHNLDVETLDNPYIQVVWEDTPENFTQERIKSAKQYFSKKYNSTNVNVITKIKTTEDTQQTIDVSVNIMDKNYQKELIKSLLESKGQEQYLDQVMGIDGMVENRMAANEVEVTPFKKWYIKKIEFSNFLSYGENQVIDFDKCEGITVVESDPPNFGGKTVLTVDLLLFLFFNTTTKTQKAEEIFNRFTDKNKVSVRGDILIDGEEYIIARQIERKMSKAGEWNVKTELEFFKKLSDGQLQNFTGEQRRETEAFMKRSIGTMDDFLMTILTTASNLEDLLESKPTARGQVLSRFLGLEFLKKKEETGKEIYSEFSKGMISNVYNTETQKQDNESSKGEIKTATESIDEVDNSLKKGQDYKDGLLNSKHSDLSQELIILDPVKLQGDINSHVLTSKTIQGQINDIKIVEPSGFYHEDKHDEVKDKLTNTKIELGGANNKVSEIESLVKKFGDGIECEHCGIKLMDAAITKKKIGELDQWKQKVKELDLQIEVLDKEEKTYTQLKKEFDEYERNKLIKEKHEVSLESNELKLEALRLKLTRYEEVQDKIKQNNDIDAKLIKANLRIDELISQKRGYERTQSTNQNEIENLLARIEKNNGLVLKIAEEFEKEKIYKIYNEIYGKNGISKIIMKTMMPVINAELQRLLQDSCLFNLEIRINDKNEVDFIMIDNSTGIERPITSGSGYEKTVGALAIRAVLSKVCSLPKPQLSVYDEVWGKVANDNLDMVGEFFDKLKTYFEKIFVISHNPMISNWANTVVKITKTDNVSKVSQ